MQRHIARWATFLLCVAGALPGGCSSSGESGTGGKGAGGMPAGAPGSGGAGGGGSGGRNGGAAGGGQPGGGGTGAPATAGNGGTGGTGNAAGGSPVDAGAAGSGGATGGRDGGSGPGARPGFFVTSDTKPDGNLGGLEASDERCRTLAAAAGLPARTWRAYLSVEMGPQGSPIHARDRIGAGPWYNVKGQLIATTLAELHTRAGDHELFLDEKGQPINGQWSGSPTPNQHDILTGSNRDGTLKVGATCSDWKSATGQSWVGHSDGLGPNGSNADNYRPWNSVHNGNCGDITAGGGAGRIYCFAADAP